MFSLEPNPIEKQMEIFPWLPLPTWTSGNSIRFNFDTELKRRCLLSENSHWRASFVCKLLWATSPPGGCFAAPVNYSPFGGFVVRYWLMVMRQQLRQAPALTETALIWNALNGKLPDSPDVRSTLLTCKLTFIFIQVGSLYLQGWNIYE